MKSCQWAWCVVISLFMIAASASAAPVPPGGNIFITDLADSVSVNVSGTLFGTLGTPSCAGEGCSFSIHPPTGDTMSTDFLSTSFTGPGETLSDWLNCGDCGSGSHFWTFSSDTDGVALTLPNFFATPTHSILENGTLQLAATITYLDANASPVGVDNIFVQSDVADAPEPSTWFMALSGLGLVGYALRRRKTLA